MSGPKRVRVVVGPSWDPPSLHGKGKSLVVVPPGTFLVADLSRHLCARFAVEPACAPPLAIEGFTLPPTQRTCDVVREDDIITFGCALNDAKPLALDNQNASTKEGLQSTPAKQPRLKDSTSGTCGTSEPLALADASPNSRQQLENAFSKRDSAVSAAAEAGNMGADGTSANSGKLKKKRRREQEVGSGEKSSIDTSTHTDEADALAAAKKAATAALEAADAKNLEAVAAFMSAKSAHKPECRATGGTSAVTAAQSSRSQKANAGLADLATSSGNGCREDGTATGSRLSTKRKAEPREGVDPDDGMTISNNGASTVVTHPLLGQLELLPGQEPRIMVEKKLRTLRKAVRRQIEWYFGDRNWAKDEHLRKQADENGFIPFSYLADFERLQQLTTDVRCMRESVQGSELLLVSECGTKLKRAG